VLSRRRDRRSCAPALKCVPPADCTSPRTSVTSYSWTAAYRGVLHALPADCVVWHWGDIDAGGLRIASHLAQACAEEGRKLQLHSMDWRAPSEIAAGRSFAPSEVKQIETICTHWGWDAEREAVANATHPIEQEELPAAWPPLFGN
jgi:hypothetical protein